MAASSFASQSTAFRVAGRGEFKSGCWRRLQVSPAPCCAGGPSAPAAPAGLFRAAGLGGAPGAVAGVQECSSGGVASTAAGSTADNRKAMRAAARSMYIYSMRRESTQCRGELVEQSHGLHHNSHSCKLKPLHAHQHQTKDQGTMHHPPGINHPSSLSTWRASRPPQVAAPSTAYLAIISTHYRIPGPTSAVRSRWAASACPPDRSACLSHSVS